MISRGPVYVWLDVERAVFDAPNEQAPFRIFLAGMFITAVAEAQYHSTLPLEVAQRGYPTALYGALVAIKRLSRSS